MGGCSGEREISLISGQAVLAALQASGVDAITIDPKDNHWLELVQRHTIDRAFIALHGPGGEDGQLQAQLDQLQIPYTGSGCNASALAMDKLDSKMMFKASGLPTPPYVQLSAGFSPAAVVAELGLPLIVKPASEGSSLGTTKVDRVEQLTPAWTDAARYGAVLAEQWIEGDEFTVGILGQHVLPVVAVGWSKDHQLYDYQAKYNEPLQSHCPATLSAVDNAYLQNLSWQAFEVLNCRGWGRVDVMRDRQNRFWLLEVNTIPGLTEHSFVPMAAAVAGLSFRDLIWFILEQTLERREDCDTSTTVSSKMAGHSHTGAECGDGADSGNVMANI